MIDYIKYTVDGTTYNLVNNGDGTWTRDEKAPTVAGNYLLTFIVSENGIITTIDSSNSLYETYLQVIVETERVAYLEKYVPEFMADISEFGTIFEIEDEDFDDLHANIERVKSDAFITTGSDNGITRLENFMNIKGNGTIGQRKSYLITMLQTGNKLSESVIKDITNTIAGADSIVTFYGADEAGNPYPGYGLLSIRVLSPDTTKDYRYEDISRALKPLVPGHVKLVVIKYFALWKDIKENYADWETVKTMADWQTVKDYIPPL